MYFKVTFNLNFYYDSFHIQGRSIVKAIMKNPCLIFSGFREWQILDKFDFLLKWTFTLYYVIKSILFFYQIHRYSFYIFWSLSSPCGNFLSETVKNILRSKKYIQKNVEVKSTYNLGSYSGIRKKRLIYHRNCYSHKNCTLFTVNSTINLGPYDANYKKW